jgi:hypothetical protein
MEINLRKLGKHEAKIPTSLATCVDFVSIWGSEPNRAQLGRLCAAAIAVSVDHAKVLPKYKIQTGDPIEFGHKIMDRLLEAGVPLASVYQYGSEILVNFMKVIPSEDSVEENVNFS